MDQVIRTRFLGCGGDNVVWKPLVNPLWNRLVRLFCKTRRCHSVKTVSCYKCLWDNRFPHSTNCCNLRCCHSVQIKGGSTAIADWHLFLACVIAVASYSTFAAVERRSGLLILNCPFLVLWQQRGGRVLRLPTSGESDRLQPFPPFLIFKCVACYCWAIRSLQRWRKIPIHFFYWKKVLQKCVQLENRQHTPGR